MSAFLPKTCAGAKCQFQFVLSLHSYQHTLLSWQVKPAGVMSWSKMSLSILPQSPFLWCFKHNMRLPGCLELAHLCSKMQTPLQPGLKSALWRTFDYCQWWRWLVLFRGFLFVDCFVTRILSALLSCLATTVYVSFISNAGHEQSLESSSTSS